MQVFKMTRKTRETTPRPPRLKFQCATDVKGQRLKLMEGQKNHAQMNDFLTFLESCGVDDAGALMAEIEWFLDDPALFFEMTEAERAALLIRMDGALAAL